MGAPLVKAEQDRSIRVEDLTKVFMGGRRLRQAKQRLVPLEAGRYITNADDRPLALHGVVDVLTYGSTNMYRPVHRSRNSGNNGE
jgi:hypothetical protein